MKQLPQAASAYKKTPEFTQDTVPKGLLHEHKTKDGTWGKIVVIEGQLEYFILEPELEIIILSATKFGVVEPTISHHIKPLTAVKFYVEFYR